MASRSGSRLLVVASIVVALAAYVAYSLTAPMDALVVYCAHDSVYSEKLLRRFERETGIAVTPRFDSESTKSLGLVNLIIREASRPQCDVFWNNELLGTLDLQEAGLLVPYQGSGFDRIPERYKDPLGYWSGFGGRLRVGIFNTNSVSTDKRNLETLTASEPKSMVVANPLYGTTRTHLTVLWHYLGGTAAKSRLQNLLSSGATEVQGNAMVKNLVAAGSKKFGWTDTDDYYVAVDQGYPVSCAPVRLDSDQTICIPNTVAIIKGTKKMEAAQRLVDFLLSEETELALANSQSRQIPLGPVDEAKLDSEVKELRNWAAEAYDLRQIAASRKECLNWLMKDRLQLRPKPSDAGKQGALEMLP